MSKVVTGEPHVPTDADAEEIIDTATEAMDAVGEDGPTRRRLPEPYRLIVALRAKPAEQAEPCGDPDCKSEHDDYELAVFQDERMDVDTTIAVLTSALKSVAESAGYTVLEGGGRARSGGLDNLLGDLAAKAMAERITEQYAARYLAHVRDEAVREAKGEADSHQNAEAPEPEPATTSS